jgi:hypothetical protein
MLRLFGGSNRQLQRDVQQLAHEFNQLRGDVTNRLQQVEDECTRIRFGRMLSAIHEAADLAVRLGVPAALALGEGLRAVVAPLPPGKAVGLARARRAWRYSDGTFMAESEKFEAYRQEYESHAAGGRVRAATAERAADGTFLPGQTTTSSSVTLREEEDERIT